MFSIMYDVITDANLDSQQRVVEMLKESKVINGWSILILFIVL